MSVLNESLASREKYAQAEPLLLDSHKQMEDKPETPSDRLEDAIYRTADLYEAWDKPEQAAEWRAKLPAESEGGT